LAAICRKLNREGKAVDLADAVRHTHCVASAALYELRQRRYEMSQCVADARDEEHTRAR
jgi:hypothetical protein